MTKRGFDIWWRVIPANLTCVVVNFFFMFTIPMGLWRGLEGWQFGSVLLGTDAAAWLAAFAYFTRHPMMD